MIKKILSCANNTSYLSANLVRGRFTFGEGPVHLSQLALLVGLPHPHLLLAVSQQGGYIIQLPDPVLAVFSANGTVLSVGG